MQTPELNCSVVKTALNSGTADFQQRHLCSSFCCSCFEGQKPWRLTVTIEGTKGPRRNVARKIIERTQNTFNQTRSLSFTKTFQTKMLVCPEDNLDLHSRFQQKNCSLHSTSEKIPPIFQVRSHLRLPNIPTCPICSKFCSATLVVPMRHGRPIRWAFSTSRATAWPLIQRHLGIYSQTRMF